MRIKRISFFLNFFCILGEILVLLDKFLFHCNTANYALKFLLQFVLTTTLPAKIQTVFLQVSTYGPFTNNTELVQLMFHFQYKMSKNKNFILIGIYGEIAALLEKLVF